MTSACLQVQHHGTFVGVTCVALRLHDIQSDLSYFQQGEDSYGFLLTESGHLLMHPLLPVPDKPHAIHYTSIERSVGAQDVIRKMLR